MTGANDNEPSQRLPRALVVMGVSGSGKTTLARNLAARFGFEMVEGDSLHPAENIEKMRRGEPLNDTDRAPWLQRLGQRLKDMEAEGRGVVATCSALKRAYRATLLAAQPNLVFVYLKAPEALLIERVQSRRHEFMPASLLKSQFAALEEPEPNEPAIVVNAALDADTEVEEVEKALKGLHS